MSYDISVIDKKTGDVVQMKSCHFIEGGTMPAEFDAYGRLVPASTREACINITYNYSSYYYQATEGDERFAWSYDGNDNKIRYGIRGLYGKTINESMTMLMYMICRINKEYHVDGKWKDSVRTRRVYVDADGKEINHISLDDIVNGNFCESYEVQYTVSEGDTSDYWEVTAANAVKALKNMLFIATECLSISSDNGNDMIWDGD